MGTEYYTSSYERFSDRPRRSIIMLTLDMVMTVLSLVVAVAMVLTYIAPYIGNSGSWLFPVLALAAPVSYVVTLLLALYWIIRWRLIRAVVMFVVLCGGLTNVSLFWRPEARVLGSQNFGRQRSTFKIMTYNVRNFYGSDGESSVADVVKLLRDDTLDVVCLQEFNGHLADKDSSFRNYVSRFNVVRFDADGTPSREGMATMAILSRYEILGSGTLLDANTSIWADLKFRGDTIRIISNHLRSTEINASDNDYITQRRYFSDTAREVKIRSIVGRFCKNSTQRGEQADSVAHFIEDSPRRRVVCGDFNDTPLSYVYRTMSQGLSDAFSECGSGYSYTYQGFYNLLRIDFMLSSMELEPLTYEVQQVDYSDHYPVVVRYRKIL